MWTQNHIWKIKLHGCHVKMNKCKKIISVKTCKKGNMRKHTRAIFPVSHVDVSQGAMCGWMAYINGFLLPSKYNILRMIQWHFLACVVHYIVKEDAFQWDKKIHMFGIWSVCTALCSTPCRHSVLTMFFFFHMYAIAFMVTKWEAWL